MADRTIKIGESLKIEDIEYVVIGLYGSDVVLAEKNTTRVVFRCLPFNELMNSIELNSVTRVARVEECVEINALSEYKKRMYDTNLNFINEIYNVFGPAFLDIKRSDTKPTVNDIANKHGFGIKKAWRLIRIYLQSGLDATSLIPAQGDIKPKERKITKKLGRPSIDDITPGVIKDEELIKRFDEAITIYRKNRSASIKDCYDIMISKHYTKTTSIDGKIGEIVLPINLRPTYKQFYNYLHTVLTRSEIEIAKTSEREYRNNSRILSSDVLYGSCGPGDICEMDECEADHFLVSVYDRSIVVGRPIVYIVIDCFSKLIMAASVSFENNSVKGATNCLLNLIEDKTKLCEKYGLSLPPGTWPDHFMPRRIRCDHGSEYDSSEFERICNENTIQLEVVSPATGSLKGQVEQFFHQFHTDLKAAFYNNGLIEKRYDSTHETKACVNIAEYRRIVWSAIIKHNTSYMEGYPLTKDMKANGVQPIPYEVWNYGVEKFGSPKYIVNDSVFRFSLLKEMILTVSKHGIVYKSLNYTDENDDYILNLMAEAGNIKKPFICRIDPRNVSYIYYVVDKQLKKLHLNLNKTGMKDYEGMALADYEKVYAYKRKADREGKALNQQATVQHKNIVRDVIKSAKKHSVKPSSKDLKENRNKEKINVAKEEQIMRDDTIFNDVAVPELLLDNKTNSNEERDVVLEDALASYKEMEDDFYGR